METIDEKNIVVGLSGATGVYAGLRLITVLNDCHNYYAHVVASGGFKEVLDNERTKDPGISAFCKEWGFSDYNGNIRIYPEAKAYHTLEHSMQNATVYDRNNLASSICSGSFKTAGMVVLPCSMNTLSSIANGRADTVLTRAADVTLKERRKLVLCIRETPLSSIHINNMKTLSDAGAIIMPVCLPMYAGRITDTAGKFIDKYVGRVLSLFDIRTKHLHTWKGD